jgi:hypothetical protein
LRKNMWNERFVMIRKLLLLVSFSLVILALPTIVWAGDIFKFRGETADAFFFSEDGGGIQTFVSVFASDGVSQSPPGRPGRSSQVFVSIFRFDPNAPCDPDCPPPLLEAFGAAQLEDSDFSASSKLESASLTATVEVFDFVSGNSFPVSINLDWDGIGDLARGNSHSHSKSPGCQFNSRFQGSFRSAEATGNISEGGTEFTQGEPSEGASISSVKEGSLIIGCN